MTQLSHSTLFAFAAMTCGTVGAIWDVRTRRIPNLLTGSAIALGLGMHLAIGGWSELLESFGALMLCGTIFLAIYIAGGMGAGDVKLIAAEGCMLGLSHAVSLLVFTALSGGLLALSVAGRHGRLRQTIGNVLVLTSHHFRRGLVPHPELNVLNSQTLRLPYAVAICAGCLLTVSLQVAL